MGVLDQADQSVGQLAHAVHAGDVEKRGKSRTATGRVVIEVVRGGELAGAGCRSRMEIQRADRDATAEIALDFQGELDGPERIAAMREKVVVRAEDRKSVV